MTLVHMAPQVPLADRLFQGRVQLLEVKQTFQNLLHTLPTASIIMSKLMDITVIRRETGGTPSTTGLFPGRS